MKANIKKLQTFPLFFKGIFSKKAMQFYKWHQIIKINICVLFTDSRFSSYGEWGYMCRL